jgi:hypothetical protein
MSGFLVIRMRTQGSALSAKVLTGIGLVKLLPVTGDIAQKAIGNSNPLLFACKKREHGRTQKIEQSSRETIFSLENFLYKFLLHRGLHQERLRITMNLL